MSRNSGGDGGVRLRVRPAVAVAVRARMIAMVAREIAAATGAASYTVDRIAKGFDRQILEKVELIFEDAQGYDVGYLCIAVDWDKLQVNVMNGADSRLIKLDLGRPVTEQLSVLLARAAAYINARLAELGVSQIRDLYTARPGCDDRMLRELDLEDSLSAEDLRKVRAAKAKAEQFYAEGAGATGVHVRDSRMSEFSLTFVSLADASRKRRKLTD
jgi:hypothetical protein